MEGDTNQTIDISTNINDISTNINNNEMIIRSTNHLLYK